MESITPKQREVLVAVARRNDAGARGLWSLDDIRHELSYATAPSKDALRSSLRRLEMRGFVRDATHRKLLRFQLTREGSKVLRQLGLD